MFHLYLGNKLASRVYLFICLIIWCCVDISDQLLTESFRGWCTDTWERRGSLSLHVPTPQYARHSIPVQDDETLTGFEVEDLVDWKVFNIMVILLPDHQTILLFWFQSNVGCRFLASLLFYTNMISFFFLVVTRLRMCWIRFQHSPIHLLRIQVSTMFRHVLTVYVN